ncbi:50S ribosomal protein L5 [Candidatus Hecatella orcuttiae]|jgi:large subunit ribosomal protein L5|uniref:50S ribosomal protein L5 n=1 Tax=Candidatus Hecatella orcuttiae TaxID=1935119 RepID=UPI002868046E|nr:50S ribosomal protein L5 [Candidatus Hecatella orcuttiae]
MPCEVFFEKWSRNPMTKPRIEKVTVNICTGKSGEPLEKASKILEQLTGQKPILRPARKTIKDFGIRRGEPIAAVVTLRKQKAVEFLTKAFSAIGNKLPASAFDEDGNFAFGIKEHIEIPGVRYDPELGVVGMNVCATLSKPGYRVKVKKRARSQVGSKHRVTPEEAMCFIREAYGVEVVKGGPA